MHWPVSTQNPAADASAVSSPTRRVLPTPASPPTSATAGSPPSARRIGAASDAISCWRPMKTGLTTLTLMAKHCHRQCYSAPGGQAEPGPSLRRVAQPVLGDGIEPRRLPPTAGRNAETLRVSSGLPAYSPSTQSAWS